MKGCTKTNDDRFGGNVQDALLLRRYLSRVRDARRKLRRYPNYHTTSNERDTKCHFRYGDGLCCTTYDVGRPGGFKRNVSCYNKF